MKVFFWQWTLITAVCLASECIASPYDNSKYIQEKYFSPKRTKPSLSIVNPLDVLRQRVMLEMARRQRENANKQAEINKEILKSIGKRGNSIDYNDISQEYLRNRYYDTARLYAPSSSYQPKERMEQQQQENRNAKAVEGKALNAFAQGKSPKFNEKVTPGSKTSSDPAMNESNREKVFLIDDPNINIINEDDGDEDSQIRYIYSLYKNRLSNSF